MTNDDYLYFKNVFSNAGALDRIVSFMTTTEDPPVERLLVPDMALTAAEYFAVQKNEKVLVLLTDMTSYADALAIVSKPYGPDSIQRLDARFCSIRTLRRYTKKPCSSPMAVPSPSSR